MALPRVLPQGLLPSAGALTVVRPAFRKPGCCYAPLTRMRAPQGLTTCGNQSCLCAVPFPLGPKRVRVYASAPLPSRDHEAAALCPAPWGLSWDFDSLSPDCAAVALCSIPSSSTGTPLCPVIPGLCCCCILPPLDPLKYESLQGDPDPCSMGDVHTLAPQILTPSSQQVSLCPRPPGPR